MVAKTRSSPAYRNLGSHHISILYKQNPTFNINFKYLANRTVFYGK